MTTMQIIELALLGTAILAAAAYVIVKGIKEKWFSKILQTLEASVKEAEKKYGTGKGAEKKQYVILAVEKRCSELGIPYSLIKKLVSVAIDKIVNDYNILAK